MRKMSKLFNMLFVIMLVLSLTLINTSAQVLPYDDNLAVEEVDENREPAINSENDLELDTEIDPEVNRINEDITTFDSDALQADLDAGVKQGNYVDVAPYYSGDVEDLDVEVIAGTAIIYGTEIVFTSAGTVTFTIADNDTDFGSFTVEVAANAITGLAFDKTVATITVGESVDFLLSLIPEDGWLENSLTISASYVGNGEVRIEPITDENDSDYIVGYRVIGVSTGVVTLSVNVVDSNGELVEGYTPAVATIAILGGTITPDENTPTITPTANTTTSGTIPATSDMTSVVTYTTILFVSVITLGYMYITKKRNILER